MHRCPHPPGLPERPASPAARGPLEIDEHPQRARWQIEGDHLGLFPVYHGCDARGQIVASTYPELVAALVGGSLSLESLAEHLLVGYNLDDHTPFHGVPRLRPG